MLHIQPSECQRLGPDATRVLLALARQFRAKSRLEFIFDIAASIGANKRAMEALAEQAFYDDETAMANTLEAILSAGDTHGH